MTFETIKTIGKILSGIVLYRMVAVLFVLCLPVISFANSLTSNNLLECKSSHQALFSHKMYAINCETLGKIRKRYELAKTSNATSHSVAGIRQCDCLADTIDG